MQNKLIVFAKKMNKKHPDGIAVIILKNKNKNGWNCCNYPKNKKQPQKKQNKKTTTKKQQQQQTNTQKKHTHNK